MLDLFKGDKRGILVFDQEEGGYDDGKIDAIRVLTGLDLSYEIVSEREMYSTITIRVSPREHDSMSDVARRLNRAKTSVSNLLIALGKNGNSGHSFDVRFYPDSLQAKVEQFGWDGDGSDFVDFSG